MLDGRLMTSAQERTNLASKIVAASDMEQRTQSRNKWFLEKTQEAELELDDNIILDDRPEKELMQLKEAQKAKVQLAQLLVEPIKT
jgi:ATPase subunit of ABC transporter with duplicated ATPase domains